MSPTIINAATDQPLITDIQNRFTLSIPPKTDIFTSPALGYHFSAPIRYTAIPTSTFKSARASISIPFARVHRSPVVNADHSPALQFDQAGLLFVLPHPSLPQPSRARPGGSADTESVHPKYIKAGVEVWEGNALGSIIVRQKWCDWSVFDLSRASSASNPEVGYAKVTLEAARLGDALMIYMVDEGSCERKLVRKVPWWFMEGETEETCWVGVYGARPDPFHEASGNMEAGFSGLVIETVGEAL